MNISLISSSEWSHAILAQNRLAPPARGNLPERAKLHALPKKSNDHPSSMNTDNPVPKSCNKKKLRTLDFNPMPRDERSQAADQLEKFAGVVGRQRGFC